MLLGTFRRADFVDASLPGELREELEHVNDPVMAQLRAFGSALFGRADQATIDLLLTVLVDLSYAFARRYLDGSTKPPPLQSRRLAAVVCALLDDSAAGGI